MIGMTKKEKFWFVFLQIITLGLIWIYWKKISKKETSESLSQTNKSAFDTDKLIKLLGGKDNVLDITNTHTKLKITYEDRRIIDVDAINSLKGVSGLFINDTSITLIVGNNATFICQQIHHKVKLIK